MTILQSYSDVEVFFVHKKKFFIHINEIPADIDFTIMPEMRKGRNEDFVKSVYGYRRFFIPAGISHGLPAALRVSGST